KRKEEIVTSRVDATDFLLERMKEHASGCKTFISASAIGYYGPDKPGSAPYDEEAPPHDDFLASTCRKWEAAARRAEDCMRTVILRFGIALGKDDGVFPQFARPQDFGIVPILGSGKQVISWIHIDDLCEIIIWALKNNQVKGIFNAVAPEPVSQKELCKTIAACKKGVKLPVYVPDILLKAGLGELSTEALKSTTVSAAKITNEGFRFQYPDIRTAVRSILDK
ncbi:MAG: TIGR01777 family protein, partial [Sphingobacteriales bacterium]